MKQILFSNWHFMRIVRLALGIFIIVQSVMVKDWTMGLLGIAFTIMPVLNIGCCGAGGCAAPAPKKQTDNKEEISFEEVL